MKTWRHYAGVACGVTLIATVMLMTQSGRALAQTALQPVQALIVNDSRNAVPVIATTPLPVQMPLWRGTPFATSNVVLNANGFQKCETAFTAEAGTAVMLTTVAGSFNVPPGGEGSMQMRYKLPDGTQHIIEVPMHPAGKALQSAGLYDQFSGSLSLGGFPVVEAQLCLVGSNSAGQLDIMGFIVLLPQ